MSLADTTHDEVPNVLRCRWERRRGEDAPPIGVVAVVGIGIAITLVLIAVTLHQYYSYVGGPRRLAALGTLAVAVGLLWRVAWRGNGVNAWIRLCSLVLVLHLGLLAVAHGVFLYVVEHNEFLRNQLHQAQEFRAARVVVGIAAALLLYLGWSRHRGRHNGFETIRKLYIAALVFMLVLGLWAPLLIQGMEVCETYFRWNGQALRFAPGFAPLLLIPPVLLAALVCVPRVEQWLLSPKRGFYFYVFVGIVLIVALVKACLAQGLSPFLEDFGAYTNCLPVLLGAGAITLMLILAMAASHWMSVRGGVCHNHSDATIEGTVIADGADDSAGRVYYQGWLPGLRMQTCAFIVRGPHGDLPIPAGTRLVASVPTWTIGASVGQSAPVLVAGDHVVVHGFEHRHEDGPFRASHLPLPGPRGIVVVKTEPSVQFWREVSLLAWRPIVLYLVIGAIVALPGLLGLLRQ